MDQPEKIILSSPVNWESSDSQVLLNPRWPEAELRRLRELAAEFPQADHLWVASSGSSTSSENSVKLIALSRAAFLASARAVNEHLQATASDVWGQGLPSFHVGGLGIFARAFLSGAKVVDVLREGQWNAGYFVEVCDKHQVSLSALVPTQVFDLVTLGRRAPKSLRAIVIGGAALSDDLYNKALDLGWPLLPSYGATETCSQVATAALDGFVGGEGLVGGGGLGHRDRRLVMLSHAEARVSEDGFLQFRGSSLLTGFAQWRSGQKIFEDPKQDGWITTRDLGEVLREGGRWILTPFGRDFEFVKISGEGVHLLKLNEILSQVVQQVAPQAAQKVVVLAVTDPRTAHRIELVVGTDEVSAADLLKICQQFNAGVAPYEKIRGEHFVNEIPRSPLGKVLWAKLREQI
jgi:O-succinylbenzoic acid--CoA ligase